MGGLEILCPDSKGDGKPRVRRILAPEGVKALANIKLEPPIIPRSLIEDRSKADTIQKGLVLLQVSWMAMQCIARKAYGLPLTLLERSPESISDSDYKGHQFNWSGENDFYYRHGSFQDLDRSRNYIFGIVKFVVYLQSRLLLLLVSALRSCTAASSLF